MAEEISENGRRTSTGEGARRGPSWSPPSRRADDAGREKPAGTAGSTLAVPSMASETIRAAAGSLRRGRGSVMFLHPRLVFLPRHETQRGGVDAIAQPGGRGAIIENMAEVGAIHRATRFDAGHPEARIAILGDEPRFNWLRETGPAGAAVEFVAAVEQRGVAADGKIDPVLVVVPIGIATCGIGAQLTGDAVLFGCKQRLPFGVGVPYPGLAHVDDSPGGETARGFLARNCAGCAAGRLGGFHGVIGPGASRHPGYDGEQDCGDYAGSDRTGLHRKKTVHDGMTSGAIKLWRIPWEIPREAIFPRRCRPDCACHCPPAALFFPEHGIHGQPQ